DSVPDGAGPRKADLPLFGPRLPADRRVGRGEQGDPGVASRAATRVRRLDGTVGRVDPTTVSTMPAGRGSGGLTGAPGSEPPRTPRSVFGAARRCERHDAIFPDAASARIALNRSDATTDQRQNLSPSAVRLLTVAAISGFGVWAAHRRQLPAASRTAAPSQHQ